MTLTRHSPASHTEQQEWVARPQFPFIALTWTRPGPGLLRSAASTTLVLLASPEEAAKGPQDASLVQLHSQRHGLPPGCAMGPGKVPKNKFRLLSVFCFSAAPDSMCYRCLAGWMHWHAPAQGYRPSGSGRHDAPIELDLQAIYKL